jgi:flagellar basal body-associated protein FliL
LLSAVCHCVTGLAGARRIELDSFRRVHASSYLDSKLAWARRTNNSKKNMKHWLAILVIVLVISLLILTSGYLFWFFNGKVIITQQLQGLTHRKVTMGYFKIHPLLNLEIKDLQIEGLAKVESVYMTAGIIGFLTGNLVLDELKIVKPEVTYERFAPAVAAPSTAAQPAKPASLKKRYALYLVSRKIKIRDARLDFIDHTAGAGGIKITVKDATFNLSNLYVFPRSIVSNFELKGSIPCENGSQQGKVLLEGWIYFYKKSMQANVKINDIDGFYFYPYYSQWGDLTKTNIEKATLSFSSDIQGLKNNVTANCHLELSDLVFKPRSPAEPQDKGERLTAVVLDIFKDLNQGKIVLDFTIRTKMDNPVFGFSNIKTAVESKVTEHIQSRTPKIKNVLTMPTDAMLGTVKGLTDVTTSTIRGTVSVIKELKDALLAPFKKAKAPKPAPASVQQK